ncbi:hypothetical protein SY86_00090 [Erwinia tracheiphila]|uniref:Uncharacterized protein n=1 Tax=Erwinia tracheiphila TaxID=65700 RepID=A0A0M2KF36_9GAMM|nr:hypothetical protein ETR_15366 [Erwinia tracheiphila PSU-1]KKF37990.1 hypothetical protein SY86_00090 [Erwinia tracheiphila]
MSKYLSLLPYAVVGFILTKFIPNWWMYGLAITSLILIFGWLILFISDHRELMALLIYPITISFIVLIITLAITVFQYVKIAITDSTMPSFDIFMFYFIKSFEFPLIFLGTGIILTFIILLFEKIANHFKRLN